RALREAWFGLAPVQQQASSVAVAEEGGQAERGEAVGGVLLHELAVDGQKLDDSGVGAQRAGFEEVRRRDGGYRRPRARCWRPRASASWRERGRRRAACGSALRRLGECNRRSFFSIV